MFSSLVVYAGARGGGGRSEGDPMRGRGLVDICMPASEMCEQISEKALGNRRSGSSMGGCLVLGRFGNFIFNFAAKRGIFGLGSNP